MNFGGFSEKRVVDFMPDNKVIARLSDSLQNNTQLKKTQVQLASRLRWDLFLKYWDWLEKNQFITTAENGEYCITPQGTEMFKLFWNYYQCLNKSAIKAENEPTIKISKKN